LKYWALSVKIAPFLAILPTLSYMKRELTDTKNINFIIYQVKKNSDTKRGRGDWEKWWDETEKR
jgi:hypothetical protein